MTCLVYGSRRILRRDHVSEASSRLAKDLVTLTKLQSHTSAPGEQVRLYSVCRRHVGQRRRHSSCSQCSGRNDTIKRRDSTQQHTCTRTVLGFRPTAIHRVKSRTIRSPFCGKMCGVKRRRFIALFKLHSVRWLQKMSV